MELSPAHNNKCIDCRRLILHITCGVLVEGSDNDFRCKSCVEKKGAFAATAATSATVTARQVAAAPVTTAEAATATDETAPSTTSSKKRSRNNNPGSGKPTCRKQKSAGSGMKIGLGSRVKTRRSLLYHVLRTDTQRKCLPSTQANNYNYFGEVVGGNSNKGYNVRFDALPLDENIVVSYTGSKLTVVAEGEEEKDYDRPPQFDSETTTATNKTAFGKSVDEFCGMEDADLKKVKVYEMRSRNYPGERINWEISEDNESTVAEDDDPTTIPHETAIPDIDLGALETSELNNTFFKHFFPDTTNHASIIDEYLSDPRAPFHGTYVHDKFKFHDAKHPDPDWKVKQCYTIIIAAATEIENGVDNLWKTGPSGGRRDYPDFGRYMSRNQFECFESAAPFCWCDRKHWYSERRDTPWDVFLPCLSSLNERRKNLVKTVSMMLDESTSCSATMYKTHFEDNFGKVQTCDINRPEIAHFLYDKQRQSILNLVQSWPTRSCWFRLLVTLTGMCVVDIHGVYKNIKLSDKSATLEEVDALAIRLFSDKLCNNLCIITGRAAENGARFNFRAQAADGNNTAALLVRIRDENGSMTRPVTTKQHRQGRSVGTARQQNCFICRKYLGANGKVVFQNTSHCCAKCSMPLCKQKRGRPMTCLQEHLLSVNDVVGCSGKHVVGTNFPKSQQVPFRNHTGNIL